MEELIEELKEVYNSEETALKCGGTYCSMCLRKCLELAQKIESYKDHQDYTRILGILTQQTEIWRKGLKRHNSQKLKVLEYDIETGYPINGEDIEVMNLYDKSDMEK